MNKPYIEFKKERDLGGIITDTFAFLRLEWKPLFTTIFKIAAIPILLAIAGVLYYTYAQANVYTTAGSQATENKITPFATELILAGFLFVISYLTAFIMINLTTMYYIKSYITGYGTINYQEITTNVKQKLGAFTGLIILIALMLVLGLFLCVIPGVYLYPILSLTTCIFVFKDKNITDAISYSFQFIKERWWETFGVLLVMGILVGIIGYIFQVPALIYMLAKTITGISKQDVTAVTGIFADPIYLFLTIISYLGRFLFFAVTLVSTVLIYFDINEQKYALGTVDQINKIGQ